MDSINRNQPEENRQDLRGRKGVAKIREIVKKAPNCFFCTESSRRRSDGARPMNVRKVDERGSLWFLIANDSQTHADLVRDPSVCLFFQGSHHSDFLILNGRATLSKNRTKIEDLWEPVIRTWFTGGQDDPRISVVKVAPTDGHYWDTKHGNAVAGIKMWVGAAIGKTLDDSVEGALNLRRRRKATRAGSSRRRKAKPTG